MDSRTLKMAKVFDWKGPVGHSGYLGGRDGCRGGGSAGDEEARWL
jgi:hypothetical protein